MIIEDNESTAKKLFDKIVETYTVSSHQTVAKIYFKIENCR